VQAFDTVVSGANLAKFLDLSAQIGGDVAKHGDMVRSAFAAQRDFVAMAAKAKQPSQAEMPALLKPTSDKIAEIQNFRESNRRSQLFNHLSAISESIPALGWVAVVSPFLLTRSLGCNEHEYT